VVIVGILALVVVALFALTNLITFQHILPLEPLVVLVSAGFVLFPRSTNAENNFSALSSRTNLVDIVLLNDRYVYDIYK
jgi:hypothetical protein